MKDVLFEFPPIRHATTLFDPCAERWRLADDGKSEATLCWPTDEPSFYTGVEEAPSDMPQLSWEAVLYKEVAATPGIVAQVQGEDITEKPRSGVGDCSEERRIGHEAKDIVKQLVTE